MGNVNRHGALSSSSQDERWLKVTARGLYEIQDEFLPPFDRTVDNTVAGGGPASPRAKGATAGLYAEEDREGTGGNPWDIDLRALAAVLAIRSNADHYLEGATADVSAQLRSAGLLLPHEHLSTAVKITASDKSLQAAEAQRGIRARAVLRLHLAITRHTTSAAGSASAAQRSSKLTSAALGSGQILVKGIFTSSTSSPSSSSSEVIDAVPTLSDLLFATSISVSASTLRGLIETHSGTPVIVSHAFLSLVSVLETMLPHMAPLPRSAHFAKELIEATASTLEAAAENEQKALVVWDRARSNPNLEFNEDSSTARRPGNASSYPAALVMASPEEICTLTLVLTEATQNNNWLTIGIAFANFPHASSDGFGRQTNSWGLQDDRSSASDSSLQACGTKEAAFRKLRLGDVVSLVADLKAGYCDVIINAGELRHRFILPTGRTESFVMGATFANDHKLRIIPLPYSLVEVLAKAETYTAANTRSVRQVRCPNNHVMSAFHGLPPSEEASSGVIIACNKCARSHIHLDKVCIFNCEQCPLSYDLCFACSIAVSNVSRRNKAALAAAVGSVGLLHNPLAALRDDGPAAVALEQLLDIGRLALDQATSSDEGLPTPPSPPAPSFLPLVRPLSANPYAQRSPRRVEAEALTEAQGSHCNVALSVMFAMAVLRQSLSGLLEVLYLLHESPQDRFILSCAERFAGYLLGGAGGEGNATISLDVFFGRHQQASSSGSTTSFEASSIRQCDLTLAGSSPAYFGLRELTRGEKQAIAIVNALGEVASGSSSAFFPITVDSELDELLGMIEKGSAALMRDSTSDDDAGAKMAFVDVAFCSAALRIVYNNLCRLFAPGKGAEGSTGSSPLDVCHPSKPSTYRHRLRSALRQITETARVDPVNSAIGKFAVSFSAFHQLTPKASEQFTVVRELLEKMETGKATLCEQELLLLHMNNLQGSKLLEVVSSSTAAAEGQDADEEDISAGANFLTSLLMLADRSLRTKCAWVRQRLSLSLGPGESKDEETLCESKEEAEQDSPPAEVQGVLQEVILKVLEPIAMQVVSMLMTKVLEELGASAGDGPRAEGSSLQVKKLNALMLALLQSAHAAVQILSSLHAERGHDLLFAALSDEIGKSHVGSLLPLSMFTLHLFLGELLAKTSTAVAASGFADLIVPLTTLSDSIRAVHSKRHGGRLSPGKGKPSLADVDVPAATCWDKALSDSHLVFNPDATACSYGEGNISNEQIYENEHADLVRSPAAFILVPDEYSSCSVVIEATGHAAYNQLSVGICRVGVPSPITGFGLSAETWGIVNPKDESEPAYFAVSGQMVGAAPRKLNAEDTVTIVSDLRTGLLRFLVKSRGSSPEFYYAFDSSRTSPRGVKGDFLYGATFATDHHLRVQANLRCLLRNQEMGSIVRACLEAGEKTPSSSWLARLKSEVQELQVIVVRQHLELEGSEEAGSQAAAEALKNCCEWLDSPLLTQGKILPDPGSPGGPTSPDPSAPALKLLRELTDAPDGLGDAQRLVALMKKYVLQDRGTVAGPSHIAHAACAAAIWHKGFSDEVYGILQASLAGEIVKPSEGLKRLWRQGQSMRKVFEPEEDSITTTTSSSLLQSPATSPPLSPVPFLAEEEEFANMGPVPMAPPMHKQFSLPPLQQGQEPLNPGVLGAVRRARLLLSFQPVSLMCAPGDPALLMEKTTDAAKSLFNFIASGPDPDELRELVVLRTETAQRRCRGLSLVLDLCRRSDIAEDVTEGTALLRRVALSLHHLADKSRTGGVSKGGNHIRAADLPRDDTEADSDTTRVHYLLNLQGSPRASQEAVRAAWFSLVAEVIKAGNRWMDSLEGLDEDDAEDDDVNVASAVLAIFAAITIDYDHVWDIEPISTSGMVDFILRGLSCSDASVRDAALVLYESVILECCRGVDYFAKIGSAERMSAANAILSVLLYQGSGCFRSARLANLIPHISSSPSVGPRPAKSSTITLESGSDKIFGYRLLDGCLLCDPAEEGSLLFLAPSPEEPADTAKDSKYLKGYSLTSWLFRTAEAPTGVLLRRGLPPLQNSDFSRASGNKGPVSFAWSSLTVALLSGGQLSVSIADPVADNKEHVFEISTPVVRTELWAFFGFSIDFVAASISLYLDNAVVATKKLSATLVEGSKTQNSSNAAGLPFRSIFVAPSSSSSSSSVTPPSTEPFCCGQMIHSHPLNAASCLLANVSLFAMPLSSGGFESVEVETLPRTLTPSPGLEFGLSNRGITCHNRSTEVQSIYACVPGDGAEAQLRLQFDDGAWSAESRLGAAVMKSDGSLGDFHAFGVPTTSSPSAAVALYLDQRRGLLLSCAEGARAVEAAAASQDISESTFEVGEADERVAFCLSLAPDQRVTLLRADVDSRLDQVDGWPKLQTACADPREQQPDAVPQLTMFNAGWSLDAPASMSTESHCHRSHVIKLLAVFVRIGKALVVLSRRDGACFDDYFCGPCGIFESFFSLAFDGASSTLRLAATRALCVFVSLLRPEYVDSVLRDLGYLVCPEGQGRSRSGFVLAAVRSLGCVANPHGSFETLHSHGPYLQVPVINRAMLVFQLREVLTAVASSPRGTWRSHLVETVSEIVGQSGKALEYLRTNQLPLAGTLDWLVGLLSAGSSDVLPGQNLYPGCRVLHKGLGSSIPEDFTVLAHGTKGSFGEQMYVAPTHLFHRASRSERPSCADGGHPFECVFTSVLQARVLPQSDTPLVSVLAFPHGDAPCNDERESLFALLQEAVVVDTTDPRPMPPYPQREDGSRGLATVMERRELIFESLHNYRDNTDELREISIPGASELVITFDPQSRTELNYDYIKFFKDSKKGAYWGAEKYSGTTWPGVNGVDPLVIPTDSCFLHFKSDGNNNDWGYRFTCVGFVPTKVPRILRPPSSALLLSRLVRVMAVDVVVKLLTCGASARQREPELEADGQADKNQATIAEFFGPRLWRAVLSSLTSSSLSRALADFDGDDRDAAQSRLEVSLSSVPAQTDMNLSTLLTMLLNNRCLVDPLRRDAFFGPSAASSPELFQSIVDAFQYKPSAPSVWAHEGAISAEPLSENLVSQMAMDGLAPMHVPSERCEVAALETSERALTMSMDEDAAPLPFPQVRLECMPSTTHCRIRAGPSMQTAEVGEIAMGSVTAVTSEVGGFYRLADDRGFVKAYVDRALDWHRTLPPGSSGISYADQSSKYAKSAKRIELQVADYWESCLLQALEGVVARSAYYLLCTALNQWPRGVAFIPDDGEAHLLLKATGMGIVTFPKNAAKKKRQTIYSKKRLVGGLSPGQLASTPLLTSFYHLLAKQSGPSATPRDVPETRLCPLALFLLSIAAGILQRTNLLRSEREVVVAHPTPDPQTLLAPVVLESLHEYENNTDSMMRIHIAGAKGLEIIFDDESCTERNYDYVSFYADEARTTQLGGKYSGKRSSSERNFPGVGDQPSLIVENRNEVWVHFVTDGTNVSWGWRLTAYPLVYCDGQDTENESTGDVNFTVAPKNAPSLPNQLLFNASDTPPSLALGVAILDAVLGGAGAAENGHLVGYLFASVQGCTLLDALLRCVEHVNQEHALTAKAFFEVVMFVLTSYQAHRDGETGRGSERESDVDDRTRLRVRALLSRLAARVVALAEPAVVSCSAQGRAVRFPSPFMQALSQAAVVCHHSGLGAASAAPDNDKAALKEGDLVEVKNSTTGQGGQIKEKEIANVELRSPESLCHAPQLSLTHGGLGVQFIDALALPAGECAIAWGPPFSGLSFPCHTEADASDSTTATDAGQGQYEHTCYVKVVSEGPPSTRLSIGLSMSSGGGSNFLGDHAAMPGSIAWESHTDTEGRRVGGVRHASVDPSAAVREVAKFDSMETGFRAGDLVGVTLIVRNGQGQGLVQVQDGAPTAGEDDAPARSSVGSEWTIEFSLNGAAKGSFTSNRPIPFLNLVGDDLVQDDHLESTFAISVGLSAQGAEVVFVDTLDVPFVARRPSSAVSPPFIDIASRAASQQASYSYQGKVITAWTPSISDPDLIFSEGATMSRRPGSSSCYPASMVHVDEARVSLTCTLVECPIGPNSMSFGIAKAGFKKTGSDGFGPSVNSWGLIESRSSGDGKVYSNRSVVATFRKMKAGDRFCMRYERAVGKAWLFIDGAGRDFSAPEFVQEFDLHRPDEIIPLVIGATFCNDHSLLVMDCPPPSLPHLDGQDIKSGNWTALTGLAGGAGSSGQSSSPRGASKPSRAGDYMSARALACGLAPLALTLQTEEAQARYLELDAALAAMSPPSVLEQVRAVHCRHADAAPPRALPSNLRSLWTVYGLLLLLTKTETHDRATRDDEDGGRALARLIPAPLVFGLLTPLCMAASTQVVRADSRASPDGHRQTIRVSGAVAYAIQVLPSSSLGPRGVLSLSAASPGSPSGHYSVSFRGAQPPRRHGAEAAPSVGAMAELLQVFSAAREALVLAGPAQLDASSGPASRSYRFAPGDVVRRPAAQGGDGSGRGGELGDVESAEEASRADETDAAPGEESDCAPPASDAAPPAEGAKANARASGGQVLQVRWRGRPEELERVVLRAVEAELPAELPSPGQGGKPPSSESPLRFPAPSPSLEVDATASVQLWQQGYWSGKGEREGGALAEGSRVLWSPVHAESVDVSILWDDSPDCLLGQSVSIAVTPLFALDTILHDPAFADLRRAVATYPHANPRPHSSAPPSPAADDADLDRACRNNSAVDHSLMQLMEKKHRDKAQSWTGMLSDKWAAFAPSDAGALVQSPALVEVLAREQSVSPDELLRAVRPDFASIWGLGARVVDAAAEAEAPSAAASVTAASTSAATDIGAEALLSSPDASAGEEEQMPAQDPRKSLFLSARVAVIQIFNSELVRCIDLIDFSTLSAHGLGGAARTMGTLLRNARSLVFSSVKSPIVEGAITKSEIQNVTRFELLISRPRAARFATRGECDLEGRWSVFGQVFRVLHGMPPSSFRKTTPLWDTVFAGERAQDAGGPYRESWSALTQELSSPHTLPLLRLCPNGRHSVGTFRDTLVLNPDATSRTNIDMLSFLGKLFGIAARSKNYLDLSLSPLVWKLLVKEVVSAEDLWCIDYLSMTWLESLRLKRALGDTDLDGEGEATFTATSLGGSLVELHPGGGSETLKMGVNDARYHDEMVAYRLREMAPAARAIRAGLETQLPPASLALLRWDELERMVCGSPTVDIELMKSACEYASCSASDEHVVWFWEVMETDFTEEDRKAFLRFAWGRSRLPLTRAGFTQLLKIQNFTKTPCDRYLPVSHTCFFSIELPRYSSKEILRQKLSYAIHHCTAIDGDETTASRRAADLSWE